MQNIWSVKIWSSSHILTHHHFPTQLALRYGCNPYFQFPQLNGKAGRFFNQAFMKEFELDYRTVQITNQKRIDVIILGDNDIRLRGELGVERVTRYAKAIADLVGKTENRLIFMGVLPSPATKNRTNHLAEKIDYALMSIVVNENLKKQQFLFNKVSLGFITEQQQLCEAELFELDNVHLNIKGSEFLAHYVLATIIIAASYTPGNLERPNLCSLSFPMAYCPEGQPGPIIAYVPALPETPPVTEQLPLTPISIPQPQKPPSPEPELNCIPPPEFVGITPTEIRGPPPPLPWGPKPPNLGISSMRLTRFPPPNWIGPGAFGFRPLTPSRITSRPNFPPIPIRHPSAIRPRIQKPKSAKK